MQNLRMKMNLICLGLVILGTAAIGPVSSLPTADKEGDKTSDYDYTGDEEVPTDQKKTSDESKPTPSPFFNEKIANQFAKNGENVTLECPVRNYNEENHSFLWYKDEEIVANGFSATAKGYTVDKNLTLHITNFSNVFSGNYYCTIMPQNVRRQIILKLGDPKQVHLPTSTGKPKLDNLEKATKAPTTAVAAPSKGNPISVSLEGLIIMTMAGCALALDLNLKRPARR